MPTPDQIRKLIEISGNSFHSKVTRWLSAGGWNIKVSPYYMDQTQQKARELDLIAEKSISVRDPYDGTKGSVVTRLFIECKYITSNTVFWFTKKDKESIEKLVCSYGPFRPKNQHTLEHHYLQGSDKVAKLFTSENAKGQEIDPFYKAINQALNGLVSLRGKPTYASTRPGGQVLAILNFPIIVCNSFERIYATDFDQESEAEQMREKFQLEVQYAYNLSNNSRDELFIIDFVEFESLQKLINLIDEDAKKAAFLLQMP